jgi:hypothetical protein
MNILGAIFGNKENTETVLSGIDKAFFTSEEKSEFFLKYLAASHPQNVARRLIAIMIVFMWIFLILVGVVMYKIDPGFSSFVFSTLDNNVNTPFSIIIGFYFAAHLARAWKSGKEDD